MKQLIAPYIVNTEDCIYTAEEVFHSLDFYIVEGKVISIAYTGDEDNKTIVGIDTDSINSLYQYLSINNDIEKFKEIEVILKCNASYYCKETQDKLFEGLTQEISEKDTDLEIEIDRVEENLNDDLQNKKTTEEYNNKVWDLCVDTVFGKSEQDADTIEELLSQDNTINEESLHIAVENAISD